MSILIEALIEAMDEYYSINLAEEVKRGMTERVSRAVKLFLYLHTDMTLKKESILSTKQKQKLYDKFF